MDEIKLIRESVYDFWHKTIIPSIKEDDKVLEVGPMALANFMFPQYFVEPRKYIKNYKTLDIYKDNNIDVVGSIALLPDYFAPHTFDKIIALEVLEHVEFPHLVPQAIHNILKPDGILYLSTPFWFLWHDPRPDYWRFSADGLSSLFEPYFKLEIIPLLAEDDDGRHPIHHKLIGTRR